MNTYAIRGRIITLSKEIQNGQLEVDYGKISYVGSERKYRGEALNYENDLICPGFIDIHVHGGSGVDVMDPDSEIFSKLPTYLAAGGVTGFLATTHTASQEELESALRRVEAAQRTASHGAKILGSNMEGPFISQEKKGAQKSEYMRHATKRELEGIYRASGGTLKIVTMAPENRGSLMAANWLRKRGIIAAAGHTNATYEESLRAFEGGFTHLSHFYNGMRCFHHREPGLIGAGLTDCRVTLELVADGVHIHTAALKLALMVKGPAKIALVSDAVKLAGLPNGEHSFGGRKFQVRGRRITIGDEVIAGSGIRLNDAVKYMVRNVGCPPIEAVEMASYTPAKILGINTLRGALRVGMHADISVLDKSFNVLRTIVDGKTVFLANRS